MIQVAYTRVYLDDTGNPLRELRVVRFPTLRAARKFIRGAGKVRVDTHGNRVRDMAPRLAH